MFAQKNEVPPYEIPPIDYIKLIAQHCPRALMTYISLWEHKDRHDCVAIRKKSVRQDFLLTPTRLRNELFLLVREGLISISENENFIKVELVGWNDESD